MGSLDMQVPLEMQKLALEMHRERGAVDVVSITSCNSNSCHGHVLEDAANLNPSVQPAPH